MRAPRWMIWLLAFSLGLNAFLVGAWVVDEMESKKWRERRRQNLANIDPQGLELSEAQMDEWKSIEQQLAREEIEWHGAVGRHMAAFGRLISREDSSTETLQAQLDAMHAEMDDYLLRLADAVQARRALLDDEQNEWLTEMLHERAEKLDEHAQQRLERSRRRFEEKYGEPPGPEPAAQDEE